MHPCRSMPEIVVPEVLTAMSPLLDVSFTPEGTPVLVSSGKPQVLGCGAQPPTTLIGGGNGLLPPPVLLPGFGVLDADGFAEAEAEGEALVVGLDPTGPPLLPPGDDVPPAAVPPPVLPVSRLVRTTAVPAAARASST